MEEQIKTESGLYTGHHQSTSCRSVVRYNYFRCIVAYLQITLTAGEEQHISCGRSSPN